MNVIFKKKGGNQGQMLMTQLLINIQMPGFSILSF